MACLTDLPPEVLADILGFSSGAALFELHSLNTFRWICEDYLKSLSERQVPVRFSFGSGFFVAFDTFYVPADSKVVDSPAKEPARKTFEIELGDVDGWDDALARLVLHIPLVIRFFHLPVWTTNIDSEFLCPLVKAMQNVVNRLVYYAEKNHDRDYLVNIFKLLLSEPQIVGFSLRNPPLDVCDDFFLHPSIRRLQV